MRSGGYSSYQTLTPEAAAIVKQAITLAKRRGHAQVTPLHIATTMLSSSTAFLRTACLQSHSHPLQFKALELCFNVALNRLPTSVSSPILGPLSHHPSLSNALVAAFKRAQAHQRRGSVENQQQPILALKIELEQLVISILDDPSVSRVMREAGFSSTLVKSRVEQSVSLDVSSHSTPPPVMASSHHSKENTKPLVQSEDVMGVIESLMREKRKSTVVIGESLASAESAVKRVIEKFDRGDVPREMRYVQFISLPLLSLKNVTIGEAEKKLDELRRLVKSCLGKGVVLYLGDLKWVSEFWSSYGGNCRSYYCPVEMMIMELSKMLFGVGDSGKLWLMGIATSQTYLRCKTGQPSLETLWQLQPLTLPVASLGLSLNLESDVQGERKTKVSDNESSWLRMKVRVEKDLTCCTDCSRNFNKEAQTIANSTYFNESTPTSTKSSLPSWLQQYKEENHKKNVSDQDFNKLRDICIKWNSICSSVHKKPHFLEKALNHSSSCSPCSSNSISSYDRNSPILQQALLKWPVIFEPNQSPKEHQFMKPENGGTEDFESNSRGFIVEMMNEQKPDLLSNPNSSPNSASCSETEQDLECFDKFKEVNPENLQLLCSSLEKKVPWQREIIQDIASTILQCRSGLGKRKGEMELNEKREETWLFFLGIDFDGKEKVAKELAKLVFGSRTNMVKIGLSNFSSTRADSTEECTMISNKRARDESGSSYYDRFTEAVKENPSRVFFMEDIEQVDYCSQKGIMRAIQTGKIMCGFGDDQFVSLKDAIVIFSCESFSSMSRASSPPGRPRSVERKEQDDEEQEEMKEHASLDLNVATMVDDEDYVSDMGILDLVDRQIIFKIQAL